MPRIELYDARTALNYLLGQTSYIERTVNETVYPDVQYPQLVPVDTSAPEWVKTVTYFSGDNYGAADWINGNSDDIPLAGTDRNMFETAVYTAGIGYGFGLEEINQAAMVGRNLQAEDAVAARRAYEEMVDRVALYGDARKGFVGLINTPTVPVVTALNGDWDDPTTTPDEILADINAALIGQFTGTLYTAFANTILMPYDRYLTLATRKMGDNSSMSILNWLLANNALTAQTGQPLLLRGVRGLETAGAGGTARMVAYRRDPTVVKMHIPMPHRFLAPFQSGPLRYDVPGIFRLGGVDVRRPMEFVYVDGI